MSGEGRISSLLYRGRGTGCSLRNCPLRLSRHFMDTIKLSRNEAVLDLHIKCKRPIVVADTVEDIVASEWLIRDATGKEYKPEDYLTAFSRFVRDNPANVEAIQILLYRPKDWSANALTELRQKLQVARALCGGEPSEGARSADSKALIEIVSMVKHAADTMDCC